MKTTQRTIALIRSTVFIIFLVFSLGSCVYDQELTYLNDQIVALEGRINRLQEAIDGELNSIQARQAETDTKVDELERNTERLSEDLEDNGIIISRIVERDLNEMLSRLEALTQKVADLESETGRQPAPLGPNVSASQEDRAGVENPIGRGETGIESSEEPRTTEQVLYNASKDSFDQGRFEEGIEGFNTFLDRYPNSELADNAQYWIGKCYAALGRPDLAIPAYVEVEKKYPQGNKVPDAMLGQAMAWLEIDDKDATKILLKKIIRIFPESDQAKVAEQRLKTLE